MKRLYIVLSFLLVMPVLLQGQTIEFIENRGQWDGPFKYKAVTGKGDVYLQNDGFMYVIGDPGNDANADAFEHGQLKTSPILKFHAYKMTFENALKPAIIGSRRESAYYNYFLGNKPERWQSDIHPFLTLDYKNVYNGIDVHVSSDKGNLEYEFILQAGADPKQIKLNFSGADKLAIKKGDLIISTSVGQVQELKPIAWQYINDARVDVACEYRLRGNTLTYSFPNDYDASKPLTIDPTVVFATFTGSTADNWGFTATYDPQGNFYAGGIAHSTGFPLSTGAFQGSFAGGQGNNEAQFASDIAIIKYNPAGTNMIYATYIGGAQNERPHSMIVDSLNNLIIAGRTLSHDYPHTTGAFDTSFNGGWDIVVTKLNATGTALIGSTFVGGTGDDGVNIDSTEYGYHSLKHNYGDDARSEVQTDRKGNVYVTASTTSANFPVTSGAYQSTLQGNQDAVVFKMNFNLSSMVWSSYIGGSGDDAGYVIAFDTAQTSFYIAGGTGSSNFPSTSGTLHGSYQGDSADGYVLKFLNSAPYTLQKGTFIGTTGYDQVYGIQVDRDDNVYVMGQSLGGGYPVTSGVYSNANSTQFIMKMDPNLSTDIYSTVFGTSDPNHTNISPVAFLVDTCQNVYISGWGGTLSIPTMPSSVGFTTGLPVTSNAAQATTDGQDFYFIVFSKNALALNYATFMGEVGGAGEHVDGGTSRFDKDGIVYQAICGGCGGSSNFPTKPNPGAWSNTNNGGNCNEIALKIAFQFGPVQAHASAAPSTHGCAPFTVQFSNTSTNGATYNWDFDDGTPLSTQQAPGHTFTLPGTYNVRLAVANANACTKLADTVFLTIVVDTINVHPEFTYAIVDSCNPYTASFVNTSQYSSSPGSQNYTSFTWYFGDGTSYTGTTPPDHVFPAANSYTVTLVMTDTSACNSPDSISHTFIFSSLRTTASFTSPDTVCMGSSFDLTNTSQNAISYYWDFGNGQTSPVDVGNFIFHDSGTYTIILVAKNPGACQGTDTFIKTITVLGLPTALFTYSPLTPITNEPENFSNASQNATHYLWDFGDGATTTDVNPSHLFQVTNTFNVCLTAYNNSNCASKYCLSVLSDIQPLADLPKAFSPNGDGKNDVLYVRGVSIKTMDLKIYNRWGEMIFHSTSQEYGWDGTFNSKMQETDAYAFVLNVVFYDGTKFQKKGNITLLR